ncbi:hypothetical protein ACGF13_07555 [Kitasatospora sp. NPDC048286]|uniref:DUF7919 family protein n=1 Tax=Kitasatospora sp. NPDC048286 TaxID=3364047 RepID=UPI00371D72C8
MPELADLSEYTYRRHPVPMLCVGWLGAEMGVQGGVGVVDRSSLVLLKSQAKLSRSQTMGVHICELCPPGEDVSGDGEIHLYGDSGLSYAAPTMITHYVEAHGYVPPAGFLDALHRVKPLSEDGRMLAMIGEISDNQAHITSRSNAATDIPEWGDDPRIVAALVAADADHEFSEIVGRRIGESLARIMLMRGEVDGAVFEQLTPHTRWGLIGKLRAEGSPLGDGLAEPPAQFNYYL